MVAGSNPDMPGVTRPSGAKIITRKNGDQYIPAPFPMDDQG